MAEHAHVRFERREVAADDRESFDRLAFAMRALRALMPRGMTVAVFESRSSVHIDRGMDLRGGPGATWGMLAIPARASRIEIAIAVASLSGHAQDPYVLDVVLAPATWSV